MTNLKHGGESGIACLSDGQELTGLAAREQSQVELELANDGRRELVKRGAIRLESVARLFWAAIEKAVSDGDLDGLDRYAARFGWLQNSALRAWRELREEEQAKPGGLGAGDVLEAMNYDNKNE